MSEFVDRQKILSGMEMYLNHIEKTSRRGISNTVRAVWLDMRGIVRVAQSEIIHCRECVYGEQDSDGDWSCRSLGCTIGDLDGSGYCADAERRENE